VTGQLLTARTVAQRLNVCTETVLRWVRAGNLPAVRLSRGAIRIAETELEAWLVSRATPITTTARNEHAGAVGSAGLTTMPRPPRARDDEEQH
jgi:excisionase family DNA binding protein